MTPDQSRDHLIRAGEALYGARWQTRLAEDLRMSDRHMRRLASGSAEVPPNFMAELRGLLMARGVEIQKLITDMEKL